MAGSACDARTSTLAGGELHMCASRPTRDASASKCAAMFEGLGHERGAHERWSARSGAALDRDVQVVRHRALRLQSRLAPDDDADACALTRSEAGRRSNRPSVAPGVGKRWGQAALTCRSIDQAFRGDQRKSAKIRILPQAQPLTGGAQCGRPERLGAARGRVGGPCARSVSRRAILEVPAWRADPL